MLVGGIVVDDNVGHLAGWHGVHDFCTTRNVTGLLVFGFPWL